METEKCFLSSWYTLEICRPHGGAFFVKQNGEVHGAVNRWEHCWGFTVEMIFARWEMYNWSEYVCERDWKSLALPEFSRIMWKNPPVFISDVFQFFLSPYLL